MKVTGAYKNQRVPIKIWKTNVTDMLIMATLQTAQSHRFLKHKLTRTPKNSVISCPELQHLKQIYNNSLNTIQSLSLPEYLYIFFCIECLFVFLLSNDT